MYSMDIKVLGGCYRYRIWSHAYCNASRVFYCLMQFLINPVCSALKDFEICSSDLIVRQKKNIKIWKYYCNWTLIVCLFVCCDFNIMFYNLVTFRTVLYVKPAFSLPTLHQYTGDIKHMDNSASPVNLQWEESGAHGVPVLPICRSWAPEALTLNFLTIKFSRCS